MRILIPLLVLCSYASANSSIGGYNYQTPWNYYPYQNYSGWHAPQQTHQSPLSKARQDLTASLTDMATDPMMMVGAGGAVMNAVYTTVATGGVAKTVVLANARIDDSNKRITTVETRSSNTCSKVNSILALAYPTADWTDSSSAFTNANAKVPLSCSSTNPASRFIAPDQTCLASTGTYALEHAVSFTSASGSIPASNGLAAVTRSIIVAASTHTTAALSIQDFNSFRLRVAAAINELDDKIRDLLALSSLTC